MTQIFVGGLNKTSGVAELTSFFKSFGTISDVNIVNDRKTGQSRGFGFVTFEDSSAAEEVLSRQEKAKLTVDGATVDCKPMTKTGDEESKSAKKKKKVTKKRKADDDDEEGGGSTNVTAVPSPSTPITPAKVAAPSSTPSAPQVAKKAKVAVARVVAPVAPPKPAAAPGTQVFVGGIPKSMTADGLRQAFASRATIVDSSIMLDRHTQLSRGFGFVTFGDALDAAKLVLENGQIQVEGNVVTLKLADAPKPKSAKQILKEAKLRSKELNKPASNGTNDATATPTPTTSAETKAPVTAPTSSTTTTATATAVMSATAKKKAAAKLKKNAVRKIFVGGLQQTMTTAQLQEYFSQFGPITDCVVMQDNETKRSRGFGFVSFGTEEAYRAALKLKDGDAVAIKGKTEKPKKEEKPEKKVKKRRWGDEVDATATPAPAPVEPVAPTTPAAAAPVGGETMVGHEISGWKVTCRPARDKRSSESHY